jgi:hypothetical protein
MLTRGLFASLTMARPACSSTEIAGESTLRPNGTVARSAPDLVSKTLTRPMALASLVAMNARPARQSRAMLMGL